MVGQLVRQCKQINKTRTLKIQYKSVSDGIVNCSRVALCQTLKGFRYNLCFSKSGNQPLLSFVIKNCLLISFHLTSRGLWCLFQFFPNHELNLSLPLACVPRIGIFILPGNASERHQFYFLHLMPISSENIWMSLGLNPGPLKQQASIRYTVAPSILVRCILEGGDPEISGRGLL